MNSNQMLIILIESIENMKFNEIKRDSITDGRKVMQRCHT